MEILTRHKSMASNIDDGTEDEETATKCCKNIGTKSRFQQWTRGTWFCVGGGGHIQMWQPLYKYVTITIYSWLYTKPCS